MAVSPIATPVSARRSSALGRAWCTGDAGCSSTTVKTVADSMKVPRAAASIPYSRQWRTRGVGLVRVGVMLSLLTDTSMRGRCGGFSGVHAREIVEALFFNHAHRGVRYTGWLYFIFA